MCSVGICEEPFCGDGITTDPETCDDAGNNGTPGFCNTTCDGIVPTASTCTACFDTAFTDVNACGDDDACIISVFQTLATCTATCEGMFEDFTDTCFNQEAGSFDSCLGSAVTSDDANDCLSLWGTALNLCEAD